MSRKLDELVERRAQLEVDFISMLHTSNEDVENLDYSKQIRSVVSIEKFTINDKL